MRLVRVATGGELALVYLAFLAITLVNAVWQHPITYHDGQGWEGVGYHAVAECFVRGVQPEAEGPYVYRLATPWLAAKLSPTDLLRGFRIVNLLANALGVGLLWLWLRRHLSVPWVRLALVVVYLAQWDAPTRWIWFYPLHVDPWLYATLFGGLLLVDLYREEATLARWFALCGITVLGVVNREVALLVPVALLGVRQPVRGFDRLRWPGWLDWAPLFLGLAAFAIIKRSVHQTDAYSFGGTVIDFLYTKGVGGFVQAWFLAFGPVLLLALYDWRRASALLAARQDLLIYLLVCVAFGYAGGTDTERLLYWSAPVVFILVGQAMEHLSTVIRWWPLAAMLIGGQVCTSRVLWTTPDYPHEAPHSFPILQQVGSNVPFMDLFSYHGFRLKEVLCLAEWVVFAAVFLWLLRWKAGSSKTTPVAAS